MVYRGRKTLTHNKCMNVALSGLDLQSAARFSGPLCGRYMSRPMGKVFSEWLRAFVQAAGIVRFFGASVVRGSHQDRGQRGTTIGFGVCC